MSGMCIVCAINTLKLNAGTGYIIGAAMGERGIQHLAVASCEVHREAVRELWSAYSEVADKYEKELLRNDPT